MIETPLRPIVNEAPHTEGNIPFSSGEIKRINFLDSNSKESAGKSPSIHPSVIDSARCSNNDETGSISATEEKTNANRHSELENCQSEDANHQLPAFLQIINKVRKQLGVLEQTVSTDKSAIERQRLEIQQLTLATHTQSSVVSEAFQEVSGAHVLLESQLGILRNQHDNLNSLSKLRMEMQTQMQLIEEVMQENKLFIADSNEKLMKLVDECQHWKSHSAQVQREAGSVESKCNSFE